MTRFSRTIDNLYEQMCEMPTTTVDDATRLIEIIMATVQWNQLKKADIINAAGNGRAHPQGKVIDAIFLTFEEEE